MERQASLLFLGLGTQRRDENPATDWRTALPAVGTSAEPIHTCKPAFNHDTSPGTEWFFLCMPALGMSPGSPEHHLGTLSPSKTHDTPKRTPVMPISKPCAKFIISPHLQASPVCSWVCISGVGKNFRGGAFLLVILWLQHKNVSGQEGTGHDLRPDE